MNGRLLVPTFFCPKAWEGMAGDETARFCSYCHKHVHNLDALSVSERLALLSSPAASICARYKIAIRRPAPGKEESYMKHVLEAGSAVMLTGAILVVLWQMQTADDKRRIYRAVAALPGMDQVIPRELYEEAHLVMTGAIALSYCATPAMPSAEENEEKASPAAYVDLELDSGEIDKLMDSAKIPTDAGGTVASVNPKPAAP